MFPRRCPVCDRIVQPVGALICPGCISELSVLKQPACKKCGKEVLGERVEYCFDCTRHKRTFDSGVALLNYNEAAMRSVASIKYKNKREYLDFYGEALVRRYGKWIAGRNAKALVPVPIHPVRRRQRGFNQAEELADRLSDLTGIPVIRDLLIRTKKTAPQKELSPAQRLKNLQSAFALNPYFCSEKRKIHHIPDSVILVDDIFTTGSTVEACARALKAAGVEYVWFVTICTTKGAG